MLKHIETYGDLGIAPSKMRTTYGTTTAIAIKRMMLPEPTHIIYSGTMTDVAVVIFTGRYYGNDHFFLSFGNVIMTNLEREPCEKEKRDWFSQGFQFMDCDNPHQVRNGWQYTVTNQRKYV